MVAVAVDPAGKLVYVANNRDATVGVISAEAARVIKTIGGFRSGPEALALGPANSVLYVGDNGDSEVYAIDVHTDKISAKVPVGETRGLAVDYATGTLYVTHGSDVLSILSTESLKLMASLKVGKGASGVAVDEQAHVAYVANVGSRTVSVVGRWYQGRLQPACGAGGREGHRHQRAPAQPKAP